MLSSKIAGLEYDTGPLTTRPLDLSDQGPLLHMPPLTIFPPLVRKANEKSIKHLGFISLCKSTDPSHGVTVRQPVLLYMQQNCWGRKNTQTNTHAGCRLKYQKVSRQARGETGVAVRQPRPLSPLSLCVCLREIKETTGNHKENWRTMMLFSYACCCVFLFLSHNHC